MRSTTKRFRDDPGQALIELALALPIVVALLIGIVEYGRFAYMDIEVANSAHAGVQYGAQNPATASDNTGMQNAATNDGSNVTGLAATAQHLCACSSGGGGTLSSCTSLVCSGVGNRAVEFVKVNSTATVHPIFHYPGISNTVTLNGQAIMRVEQ
jgi:Flp pilus assembly protein TadG